VRAAVDQWMMPGSWHRCNLGELPVGIGEVELDRAVRLGPAAGGPIFGPALLIFEGRPSRTMAPLNSAPGSTGLDDRLACGWSISPGDLEPGLPLLDVETAKSMSVKTGFVDRRPNIRGEDIEHGGAGPWGVPGRS